jgi:TDG/mug DNA glycosylase family protein
VIRPQRPTAADLKAAAGRGIPDVLAPGLAVVFCGINPGLYSAAVGHHFARPGNRFWPALWRGGFTERQLHPSEQRTLLAAGYGITNLVERSSARADELTDAELIAGGKMLEAKIASLSVRAIAFLGVTAYRTALRRPHAVLGAQPEPFGGAVAWVLPNPSGLNAHYRLDDLGRQFDELRQRVVTRESPPRR